MLEKVPGHKLINQFSHHSRLRKYTMADSKLFEEVDRNTNNSHVEESNCGEHTVFWIENNTKT